jgi:hypothetical protein
MGFFTPWRRNVPVNSVRPWKLPASTDVAEDRSLEPLALPHLEVVVAQVVVAQVDPGVDGLEVDRQLALEGGGAGGGQRHVAAERPGLRFEAAADGHGTGDPHFAGDAPAGALCGQTARGEENHEASCEAPSHAARTFDPAAHSSRDEVVHAKPPL